MTSSRTISIYLCDNRSGLLLDRGDGGAMADNGGNFSIKPYHGDGVGVLNGVYHIHSIHHSQGILDFSI